SRSRLGGTRLLGTRGLRAVAVLPLHLARQHVPGPLLRALPRLGAADEAVLLGLAVDGAHGFHPDLRRDEGALLVVAGAAHRGVVGTDRHGDAVLEEGE